MNTLIRWRPMRNRMNLFNEFDRLLESDYDWPLHMLRQRWPETRNWGLALDVAEQDDNYIVHASLPGMDPDDFDITLEDNVLTIKGEIREDETLGDEQYHMRERRFGHFSRSITLPTTVEADNIEATYEQGVLTLEIPKTEEVKPKRIAVKANGQ